MACAIFAMAWRPDEHCLLTVDRDVVCGIPEDMEAIRNATAAVGGDKTLPMHMSWIRDGGIKYSSSVIGGFLSACC